jgi:hypothetical protein
VRRHLRKIYVDPMTGSAEWGVVKQPEGGIVAVHSLSHARPLRTGNFTGAREAFAGRQKYSEWVFRAEAAAVVTASAGAPGSSTAGPPAGTARPEAVSAR